MNVEANSNKIGRCRIKLTPFNQGFANESCKYISISEYRYSFFFNHKNERYEFRESTMKFTEFLINLPSNKLLKLRAGINFSNLASTIRIGLQGVSLT